VGKSAGKVGKVLFTREQIRSRLNELAAAIETRYGKSEITIVAVLKGSLVFTADLIRRLSIPVRVDILEVSSYFDGTKPSDRAVLSNYLVADVRGRHVLVVDDIVDTGATLRGVLELLQREKPRSLATCVFLKKGHGRLDPVGIDFCGFELKSPEFVVGYGLDYAQRYRNLPYLAVLKKQASKRPKAASRRPGSRKKGK
jgi:hypoxanthine phosphoribosyltransferase